MLCVSKMKLQSMENGFNVNQKAICLFSGGLDSATVLYYAIKQGYEVFGLSIHYGQLHEREIQSALKIARNLGIQHEIINIELPWKGSSLLDSHMVMPEKRNIETLPAEIPNTYVPARNTIFLSLAASFAEAKKADTIFIGANAIDYSGYPDCRPEYLIEFEHLIQLGTKSGVEGKDIKIVAPLVQMNKAEIIRLGTELEVPYEWTWSCYRGVQTPCGTCDSCLIRAKGFQDAGLNDPLLKHLEIIQHD